MRMFSVWLVLTYIDFVNIADDNFIKKQNLDKILVFLPIIPYIVNTVFLFSLVLIFD